MLKRLRGDSKQLECYYSFKKMGYICDVVINDSGRAKYTTCTVGCECRMIQVLYDMCVV